MAKKDAPVRKYNFSDARLEQLATEKASFLTRDLVDLAEFGLTAAKVTAFRTANLAFGALPTDEEELGEQVDATEDKDTLADQVRESNRNLAVRVENKFGLNSVQYRKLAMDGMADLDDANLLKLGKRVGRVCNDLLADLASEGLTAAILTAHTTLLTSFDGAQEQQSDEVADRDDKQQVRVNAGNLLYDDMVKYCNYGQRKYFAVNEAKYNDYIIYNTITGAPEVPPPPGP